MSITPAPTPEIPDEEPQRQQQEQQYQEQPYPQEQYQQPYEQPAAPPEQEQYQQQYYEQPSSSEPYVSPAVQRARRENSIWKWIVVAMAVLYVAGSIYFIVDMRGRLQKLEHSSDSLRGDVHELNRKLVDAQADTDTLASQLGITKK